MGYCCYDPPTNCTYITMDVTFLELDLFYSLSISTSPLQGETWVEEQKWWECIDFSSIDTGVSNIDDVVGGMGDVIEVNEPSTMTTSDNATIEGADHTLHDSAIEKTLLLQVPDNDESPIENILEVTSPTLSVGHVLDTSPTGYHLPFRHNRGKPLVRYSLDLAGKGSKFQFLHEAIPGFDGHYDHWSMLMEKFLRYMEYFLRYMECWQVVEPTARVTLSAIDRPILKTNFCRETSKDIWNSLKKKYQSEELQTFRKKFETLAMKDGGPVTSYYARTMGVNNKIVSGVMLDVSGSSEHT
ncbi:hypothetical protein RJ641_018779 [Dillenia turbinata]|uniref:Uncharacterized protein n=1 Tax=Dillenia turbinata TaxID=194707 RepID=A0AAN8Z064_9MAGN